MNIFNKLRKIAITLTALVMVVSSTSTVVFLIKGMYTSNNKDILISICSMLLLVLVLLILFLIMNARSSKER